MFRDAEGKFFEKNFYRVKAHQAKAGNENLPLTRLIRPE
jgi:hypothetical protein